MAAERNPMRALDILVLTLLSLAFINMLVITAIFFDGLREVGCSITR